MPEHCVLLEFNFFSPIVGSREIVNRIHISTTLRATHKASVNLGFYIYFQRLHFSLSQLIDFRRRCENQLHDPNRKADILLQKEVCRKSTYLSDRNSFENQLHFICVRYKLDL